MSIELDVKLSNKNVPVSQVVDLVNRKVDEACLLARGRIVSAKVIDELAASVQHLPLQEAAEAFARGYR